MFPRKLSQAPSRKVCKLESESLCVAIYSICTLIIICFSVGKDSFNIPEIVFGVPIAIGSKKWLFWFCEALARVSGQNQMCSRKLSGCGWLKLFLKKCGGKK